MGVERNYLDAAADAIRQHVPSDDLPQEDTVSLFRAYAVLLLAKGHDVTGADVHNAWVAWMLNREPTHEALVPYSDLPQDVAAMDAPFVRAIREVADMRGGDR